MITLVVIPARGGSKGIPRKNIKLLNKKPLIHYTIEAARKVFEDKYIYVSTDSEKIKSVAEQTGLKVPFLRPDFLATDTSNSRDVLLHALEQFTLKHKQEPDIIILLQPTSPFRNETHIKAALTLYNTDLDMVVSVKETNANPYYVLFEEDSRGFLAKSKNGNFTRRQDCPKVWEYNGAIYVFNTNSLKTNSINDFTKVIKYKMNSYDSLDIDEELDFNFADFLMKEKYYKISKK
jgi:CMP-N,N'-diacetyllegionaminic acid synthase